MKGTLLVRPASDKMSARVQKSKSNQPQEEAARWRAIVESAVDGIIVIDRRGQIEFFNTAAERMFGYASDDVIGRNVSILMPQPHASAHDGYITRYLTSGVPHIIGIGRDVMARRQDGRQFPVHLSVGAVSVEGETKFTGIVRDLTEQVELERKLREEAALARIGELAAVLAHEVRNPLAAVSAAMQVLSEKLTSHEDREIVDEALRRLDALGAMMTDLLLYARPPKPRLELLDVTTLAESLMAFLRLDPAWSQVTCKVSGDPQPVLGDAELLKVALQNLLLNALHAMDGRGDISVVIARNGGTVHLDVRDSGTGIPATAMPRLFTPFFTTKARGTGLGLPTARRIARAHGGDIDVVGTGPSGTTIRLRMPVHDSAEPSQGTL
jgi:two-component system, LuxR family, sensor kinase FixL